MVLDLEIRNFFGDYDEVRCSECGWVVKEFNNNQCLNRECSKRNKEECEARDYFHTHGKFKNEVG